MHHSLTRRRLLAAAGLGALAPPLSAPAGRADAACLDALLSARRMVRRFRPEPVDDATVRRLIAAATRAPSAGNTQPWAFVVSRAASRRRALAEAALGQTFVAEAPVVITACADVERSQRRYPERGARYAVIDVAFASLLLLLAVVEEDLGACFVGAFRDADVARLLGLPAHVRPVGVIPVGHPAEEPGPATRRPLRDVVRRETWDGDAP